MDFDLLPRELQILILLMAARLAASVLDFLLRPKVKTDNREIETGTTIATFSASFGIKPEKCDIETDALPDIAVNRMPINDFVATDLPHESAVINRLSRAQQARLKTQEKEDHH